MSFAARLAANPGRWACLGALLLLAATIAIIGPSRAPGLVWTSAIFASFYLIVGLGQMLVITAGNGNIDLSVPSVMTLAAYVSIVAMRGEDGSVPIGLLLGLGSGLACGVANAALVIVARIPPMIATLAVGFIVLSMATAYSHGTTALTVPGMASFAASSMLGIPSITALALIGAIGFAALIRYSVFGRSVEAIGQRERAAVLASIRVNSTVAAIYLVSGLMAAAAGILLAAYAGGSSLAMAENFLVVSMQCGDRRRQCGGRAGLCPWRRWRFCLLLPCRNAAQYPAVQPRRPFNIDRRRDRRGSRRAGTAGGALMAKLDRLALPYGSANII